MSATSTVAPASSRISRAICWLISLSSTISTFTPFRPEVAASVPGFRSSVTVRAPRAAPGVQRLGDPVHQHRDVQRLEQHLHDRRILRPLDHLRPGVGGHQQDRRHRAGRGQRTQIARRLDPVHPGHPPVHQHDVEALAALLRLAEDHNRRRPVRRRLDRGEPKPLQRVEQDGPRDGVVLDHQDPDVGRVDLARQVAAGPGAGVADQDGEGERAALAENALHRDLTAHQLDELPADRQAQSGAAEAPGGRTVGLGKRPEQLADLLRRHADPGVGDLDLQPQPVGLVADRREPHDDLAGLGELEGVADQVDQHLGQPQRIADQGPRDRRIGGEHHLDRLLALLLADQRGDVLQHVVETEGRRLDRQPSGLDLREIQDIVDDAQQGLRRPVDLLEVVAGPVRQTGPERQAAQPDDRVHRRADLVAHVRQELGLGARRVFGLGLGRREPVHRTLTLQFHAEPAGDQLDQGEFAFAERPCAGIDRREVHGAVQLAFDLHRRPDIGAASEGPERQRPGQIAVADVVVRPGLSRSERARAVGGFELEPVAGSPGRLGGAHRILDDVGAVGRPADGSQGQPEMRESEGQDPSDALVQGDADVGRYPLELLQRGGVLRQLDRVAFEDLDRIGQRRHLRDPAFDPGRTGPVALDHPVHALGDLRQRGLHRAQQHPRDEGADRGAQRDRDQHQGTREFAHIPERPVDPAGPDAGLAGNRELERCQTLDRLAVVDPRLRVDRRQDCARRRHLHRDVGPGTVLIERRLDVRKSGRLLGTHPEGPIARDMRPGGQDTGVHLLRQARLLPQDEVLEGVDHATEADRPAQVVEQLELVRLSGPLRAAVAHRGLQHGQRVQGRTDVEIDGLADHRYRRIAGMHALRGDRRVLEPAERGLDGVQGRQFGSAGIGRAVTVKRRPHAAGRGPQPLQIALVGPQHVVLEVVDDAAVAEMGADVDEGHGFWGVGVAIVPPLGLARGDPVGDPPGPGGHQQPAGRDRRDENSRQGPERYEGHRSPRQDAARGGPHAV